MGGRLSTPRSADLISEASRPTPPRRTNYTLNARTLTAPFAALIMAGLLFIYARTSIRAAKLNAQKHREADGGQISWHNENLRRHGRRERIDDRDVLRQALLGGETRGGEGGRGGVEGAVEGVAMGAPARSVEEEALRRRMGKGGRGGGEG